MEAITINSQGPAVEDIQQRLVQLGYLGESEVDGAFGQDTAQALRAFCADAGLEYGESVDEKLWAALVDATFCMGDRSLYLRMPYFHGHDVVELQQALGALGFDCGGADGIFGAHTEDALRKFQLNLGLYTDGIAGSQTFAAISRLHHSWEGKGAGHGRHYLGFARVADVLERHGACLFGTSEFTRDVASRMSNLALATNPSSKIVSADALLVRPDEDMLMMRIVLPQEKTPENTPRVSYGEDELLAVRLESALDAARMSQPPRLAVEVPSQTWEDAQSQRSAQHFAITLLDALCAAFARLEKQER